MDTRELSREAEDIRGKIKNMIPETAEGGTGDGSGTATLLSDDKEGNKRYGGRLLTELIYHLTAEMNIGEGWGYNLVHFPKEKQVKNDRRQMYLVPLSSHTVITPGGPLEEGYYTYLTTEPWLNSKATVIVFIKL